MKARCFFAAGIVWIVVPIAGSWVVMTRLGDYGSILQPLVGIAVGFCGAVAHSVLYLFRWFRALGFFRRGLVNWVVAYLLLIATAAVFVNPGDANYNPRFWPDLARMLVMYTGLPMLFLAQFVALLVSLLGGRKDNRDGPPEPRWRRP